MVVSLTLLRQRPLQVGSPHRRAGLERRGQLPEHLLAHELLEPFGVKAWPVNGDCVAVVNEGLQVVLHLLGDAVLLEDVDNADEEEKVLPAVIFGRNAAPDVVQAGRQSEVRVFEYLAVCADAGISGDWLKVE